MSLTTLAAREGWVRLAWNTWTSRAIELAKNYNAFVCSRFFFETLCSDWSVTLLLQKALLELIDIFSIESAFAVIR